MARKTKTKAGVKGVKKMSGRSVIPAIFILLFSCAESSHETPSQIVRSADPKLCSELWGKSPVAVMSLDEDEGYADDDSYEYAYGIHYQGEPCLPCHSSGEYVFWGGGTVFDKLDAPSKTEGKAKFYVKLVDEDCREYVSFVGKGSGNFYFTSGPSKNFFPLVVNPQGQVVNRSSAPHDPSRYNCNSCHTQKGNGEAPGRIVAFSK